MSFDQLGSSQPAQAAPVQTAADAPSQPSLASQIDQMQPAQDQPQQQAPAGAPAPQRPGLWHRVLKGALEGLAEHGIPGAVAGAIDPANAQRNRDARQSMLGSEVKFKSAQAASAVADAAMKDKALHSMDQAAQDRHNQSAVETAKFYTDTFGAPQVDTPNTGAHASASMQTLSDANGGIDHMIHLNMGDRILSWDTSNASNAAGAVGMVRAYGKATGSAQFANITPGQWKTLPPAQKTDIMARASDIMQPVIPTAGKPTKETADTKGLEQQLARLQASQRVLSSNINAQPELQPYLDMANRNIASVQAQMDKQTKESKDLNARDFQQQKDIANIHGKAIGENKVVQTTNDQGTVVNAFAKDAVNKPAAQVGNELQKSYIKPAMDAEKSYSMFNDAYDDYKKGAKTGAPSMLALSQHLATTFGGVKGSRITKDMIQEHLGARNISDRALVAVQKFTNGDQLAPDQWEEFKNLVGQSRQLSWANARKFAAANKLDVRQYVPKDLGGTAEPLSNYAPQDKNAPAASGGADPFAQFGGKAH